MTERNDGEDMLNSLRTLPQLQLLKSRGEILATLKHDRPDLQDGSMRKLILWYRIIHGYIQFFKEGISNVWRTYRELKKTVYRRHDPFYIFDNGLDRSDKATGSSKDKKMILRSLSLDQIIGELATAVRCQHNVEGDKMWLFEKKDDRNYIRISRKQLQSMIRNKYDMRRLPFFAVLFAILEEFSLAICWLSPYILPTTCLFPKFMPRYYSRSVKAQKELKKLRKNVPLVDIASRNPYSMSTEESRFLCEFLLVNRSFKWANYMESRHFMCQRLLKRYKEISLDNYLIVRDGGVDKLDILELFDACIRRGLIDIENLMQNISHNKTNSYYTNFPAKDEMRKNLRKFIVDFNDRGNNAGLLGLYATAEPATSEAK
ncbi:hypothetical protein FOA43_000482 [Brettanomyces nanus]|uniref:Uncharacterized protein n=1 Tax=Eeniella nana TaxID=13502 RepID=A0A875RWE8_EENNA|nr:uncharacterized protein FOA43_000482 [Brettanomyces nanus]QPG73176.1 hypothetical protein FOA43_000482 [Brettanomyces nanus]